MIVCDGGNMKICLGHGDMEIWRYGVSNMWKTWITGIWIYKLRHFIVIINR